MSKVLVVDYCASAIYHLPNHINLEDETQVERYIVKWSILYILLTNGKWIKIEPYEEPELDMKYGDNHRIHDADDYDMDESEEPKWEYEEEECEEVSHPADAAKTIVGDIINKILVGVN